MRSLFFFQVWSGRTLRTGKWLGVVDSLKLECVTKSHSKDIDNQSNKFHGSNTHYSFIASVLHNSQIRFNVTNDLFRTR